MKVLLDFTEVAISRFHNGIAGGKCFPHGHQYLTHWTAQENSSMAFLHCCSGSLESWSDRAVFIGEQVQGPQEKAWENGVEGCTSSDDYNGLVLRSFVNDEGDLEDDRLHHGHYIDFWCKTLVFCIYLGHIGSMYIILCRLCLSLVLRMCMLQFDAKRSFTIQELGCQYVRLTFWSLATFTVMWWKQQRRSKNLLIVGGRRYSVSGRVGRKELRTTGLFFAILICQGHAVQSANRIGTDTDMPLEFEETRSTDHNASQRSAHCPGYHCSSIAHWRILEESVLVTFGIDDHIYPLPETIGEALEHPRRIVAFPSWENLQELITVGGYDEDHEQKYTTFGLKGHDCGRRHLHLLNNNKAVLLQEINRLWNDQIQEGNFLVHLIDPQPAELPHGHIGLIVEIPVGEYPYDDFAAVYFEKFQFEEGYLGCSWCGFTSWSSTSRVSG